MNRTARARGRTWIRHGLCLLLALSGCSRTERAHSTDDVNATGADAAIAMPDIGTAQDISLAAAPDGWVRTPTRCGITLWGPPDMLEIGGLGTDSCVFHYRTASCDIAGGSDGFADQLTQDEGELEYETSAVRVDGRQGKLVQYRQAEAETQPYVAALLVPLPSPAGWHLDADLYVSCSSSAAREEALASIRTATIRSLADGEQNTDSSVSDANIPRAGSHLLPIVVGEYGQYGGLSVQAGEVFALLVKYIGGSDALAPVSSSPNLRFLGIDPTPSSLQTPGGPVRLFRFEALATGTAEVSFPGAALSDASTADERTLKVYVYQP